MVFAFIAAENYKNPRNSVKNIMIFVTHTNLKPNDPDLAFTLLQKLNFCLFSLIIL